MIKLRRLKCTCQRSNGLPLIKWHMRYQDRLYESISKISYIESLVLLALSFEDPTIKKAELKTILKSSISARKKLQYVMKQVNTTKGEANV